MGAGASAAHAASSGVVNPTGAFTDEHFYTDWPFACVESVLGKVQAMQDEDAPLAVTKAQFFNLFVDHSVFIDDPDGGDFLKVPSTEFQRVSQDGKSADTREVFVLLALLCDGPFEQRMRLLFSLFDVDTSGLISAEEMELMVTLLLSCLKLTCRIGAGAPAANAVIAKQIKRKAVNEGDKDGNISVSEFLEWAAEEANGCGIIIKNDEKNDENKSRRKVAPRKAVKLDAGLSKAAHKRAKQRFGLDAVKGVDSKAAAAEHAAIKEYAGKDARVKRYTQKQAFREKQGKLSAVASKKVMTDLMHNTTFSYSTLAELRAEFANAADTTSKKGKMYLSAARFKELLMVKFPSVEDGKMLERVLSVYDTDQNGRIDFAEFVKSLHKFGGTNGRDGQIAFLMEMLGADERPVGPDGNPTSEDSRKVEFYDLADLMQDALDDCEEVGKYMMKQVGHLEEVEGEVGEKVEEAAKKKRETRYERDQVQTMIAREPMYVHFLWVYLPPLFPAMNTALDEFFQHLESEGSKLDLEGALALGRTGSFSSATGIKNGVHSISFRMFWEEIGKALSIEADELAKAKLEAYFDLMKNPDDKNHLLYYTAPAEISAEHLLEDHADAMLLWSGLAKFIVTRRAKAAETESGATGVESLKADDQTKILYALMTWNNTVFRKPEGPPSISGDSLGDFAAEALRRVRGVSGNLSNMLGEMDEDGDGQISVSELTTLSKTNPELFLMLLGV